MYEISTSLIWNNPCGLWNIFLIEKCEIKYAFSYCGAIFHTRSVFHIEAISHAVRRISLKKAPTNSMLFFWWERVDSNHRRRSQQIYSLPPLATRELSLELVMGLEPATCWLQISCSANWATPANIQLPYHYTTRFYNCQHNFRKSWKENGRGDRTWTCGILVPNQALYQTELRLDFSNAKIIIQNISQFVKYFFVFLFFILLFGI